MSDTPEKLRSVPSNTQIIKAHESLSNAWEEYRVQKDKSVNMEAGIRETEEYLRKLKEGLELQIEIEGQAQAKAQQALDYFWCSDNGVIPSRNCIIFEGMTWGWETPLPDQAKQRARAKVATPEE